MKLLPEPSLNNIALGVAILFLIGTVMLVYMLS